jgi:hypothetical protein
MARYNPEVLNTIRLVTFDTDNGPVVRAGYMHAAIGSRSVDNWAAGGVAVSIDIARGLLTSRGLVKGQSGFVSAHPRAGIAFEGQELPHYREAARMVCVLHARLRAKSLGWDVALLESGPAVVEAISAGISCCPPISTRRSPAISWISCSSRTNAACGSPSPAASKSRKLLEISFLSLWCMRSERKTGPLHAGPMDNSPSQGRTRRQTRSSHASGTSAAQNGSRV